MDFPRKSGWCFGRAAPNNGTAGGTVNVCTAAVAAAIAPASFKSNAMNWPRLSRQSVVPWPILPFAGDATGGTPALTIARIDLAARARFTP